MRTGGDDSLADAFWAVARRLRGLTRETLEPWDITPSHSRALQVLLDDGPMRLSALSERLRIAPRSATEVVDGLQRKGLVERRPDPDDRRATVVGPTAEGTAAGRAIRAARREETQRFFGGLSNSDQAHLARILRKLRD